MTIGSVVKVGRPRRSNAPPPLPMYERVVLKHVPTMVRRKYDKLDIEKLSADENNEDDIGREGGAIDVNDRDHASEAEDHVEDEKPYSEQEDSVSEQEDSVSEQDLREDEDTTRLEEDALLTYDEVDYGVADECLDRGQGDSIDGDTRTLGEDVDSETIQLTDSRVQDRKSESEVVSVDSHPSNVDEVLGDGIESPVKDSKIENVVVAVAGHEACNKASDIDDEAPGARNIDSDNKHDSPVEDSRSDSEVVAVATCGSFVDSNVEDENRSSESSDSSEEDSESETEGVAVATRGSSVDSNVEDKIRPSESSDSSVEDSESESEVVAVATRGSSIDSNVEDENRSSESSDSSVEDSKSESEVVAVATCGSSIDSNVEDDNRPSESSDSLVEDSESGSEVVAVATRSFSIGSNVEDETQRDGNIISDNEHDASEESSACESEVVAAAGHAYVDPKIEDAGHSDGNMVSGDEHGHCRSEDNGANAARDICVTDKTGDKGEGNSDSLPSKDYKSEEQGTKDADCTSTSDVDANVDVETKEDECRHIDDEQERKTTCEDIDCMKSIPGLKLIDIKTEGQLVENVKLAGEADASPKNEVQKAHQSFHNEHDSGSDGSKITTEKDVYELCCPICQHCITRTIVFRRRENNQQDRTTCLTFLIGLFPCFRQ